MERKNTKSNFIEKNSFFILVIGLMIGGVIIGTLAFCGMDKILTSNISFVTKSFMSLRADQSATEVFLQTLMKSVGQLFFVFLLGFWAVAQPIEFFIPLFNGLGLGSTFAQIFALEGVKAFGVISLLILPYVLISTFALVIAIRESIRLSNILFKNLITTNKNIIMRQTTKLYCQKFLVLFIIMVIASIVDGICALLFSGVL